MIRMKGIRKEYHMGDNVLAALDGVDIHIKPMSLCPSSVPPVRANRR